MTLLSLIGHQAKVTNCIRSRFCKYKPGCGVSHNSNHRAAELVTRAIPQLSQETEHFCRSVNKSCEDCPVWAAAANKLTRLEETQHFCGWGQKKVAKIVQCGEIFRKATLKRVAFSFGYRSRHKQNQLAE